MITLIDLAAWLFDLFLGLLETLTASALFVASRTFRRQAYERWARQGQLQTAGEISRSLLAITAAAALAATSLAALVHFI
jgi:uncharacterized protein (UPF0128 family)